MSNLERYETITRQVALEKAGGYLDRSKAITVIAGALTGEVFPFNTRGIASAQAVLDLQHQRTTPSLSEEGMTQMIRNNNPIFPLLEQSARSSIGSKDFSTALRAANHLNAYGEVDVEKHLGGKAFDSSLNVHRRLVGEVCRNVPFSGFGGRGLGRANDFRQQGNHVAELGVLRDIIHTAVFNGYLGNTARSHFDPRALDLSNIKFTPLSR